MVTVRQAEPGDADSAVEVLRLSITKLCVSDHGGDTATLARWLANKRPQNFLAWLGHDDNYCVVAEEGDRLTGVGLLHRSGEVRLCYLMPGAQGRGIGTAIYRALEDQARVWGLRALRLESTVAARPFYERCGFRPVGTPVHGFGLSHCYPYEKQLQPSRAGCDQ